MYSGRAARPTRKSGGGVRPAPPAGTHARSCQGCHIPCTPRLGPPCRAAPPPPARGGQGGSAGAHWSLAWARAGRGSSALDGLDFEVRADQAEHVALQVLRGGGGGRGQGGGSATLSGATGRPRWRCALARVKGGAAWPPPKSCCCTPTPMPHCLRPTQLWPGPCWRKATGPCWRKATGPCWRKATTTSRGARVVRVRVCGGGRGSHLHQVVEDAQTIGILALLHLRGGSAGARSQHGHAWTLGGAGAGTGVGLASQQHQRHAGGPSRAPARLPGHPPSPTGRRRVQPPRTRFRWTARLRRAAAGSPPHPPTHPPGALAPAGALTQLAAHPTHPPGALTPASWC
jgi:hypothetical protein